MTENDAEDIIELTEIVEEPDGATEGPDEEAIRRAFEEDDFFSKIEEVEGPSDHAEGEGPDEESLAGDDDFLDELFDSGEEDQDAGPDVDERSEEELSEDVVDLEDLPETEPEDLEKRFEFEESSSEVSTEGLGAEAIAREDVDDEFGELEDFKIEVSLPESVPEDVKEAAGSQPAELSETSLSSEDDGRAPSTEPVSPENFMGTVGPEKVEAILERVAREVLGEKAERIFTEVAERVLKEEIERIKAEINRLSNRD